MLKHDMPNGTWALFDDGTHRRFYSHDTKSWPLTISPCDVLGLAKLLPAPSHRQEAGLRTPADRHAPCVLVETSWDAVYVTLGVERSDSHLIWSSTDAKDTN